MARFYRTASATPLDYMYKINVPLMERVIRANDQYITENLDQGLKMEALANSFPYMKDDEIRAQEISQGYSSKIDDIVSSIREDPANWRRRVPAMRDLSRKLAEDFKVGEISKISGNYGEYKKISDYIDKQAEQYAKTGKGLSAEEGRAYKEYFLNKFRESAETRGVTGTGYDPNTKDYTYFNAFNPMATMDLRKYVAEEMDKIKSDKKKYRVSQVTGTGEYLNDVTNEWEAVTPEKVLSIATDRLMGNPQIQNYLQERTMVGLMDNIYDPKTGQMIQPYTYDPVDRTPEEQGQIDTFKEQIKKTKDPVLKNQLQQQLDEHEANLSQRRALNWDDRSGLAPILRGVMDQFSFLKTNEDSYLRGNPVWSTKFTQGQMNYRQGRQLAQQQKQFDDKLKNTQDQFEEMMRWRWASLDKKGTGKGTTPKPGEKQPTVSDVSRIGTHSFTNDMTTDPNGIEVPVLSPAGLAGDIDRLNKSIPVDQARVKDLENFQTNLLGGRKKEDLNPSELNLYNNYQVEKEALQNKVTVNTNERDSKRQLYKNVDEAVLSNNEGVIDINGNRFENLSEDDVKLYKKYTGTNEIDKQKAEIKQLMTESAGTKPNDPGNQAVLAKISAKKDELDRYRAVKEKVDERRRAVLYRLNHQVIDSDAINIGEDENQAIGDILWSNPQGMKIFNDIGRPASSLGLEGSGVTLRGLGKGDNYNMTMEGAKNLKDYIEREDVKITYEKVGTSTSLGTGNAIVKVKFDDPNGQIPDKPFFIELTPEVQKHISRRLSLNKNPEVQKIANRLADDEVQNLRNQFITPTFSKITGATNQSDPITYTVYVNRGNAQIPLQVTKFIGANGQEHLNITKTDAKTGQKVPLGADTPGHLPPTGIAGFFNGTDEAINYILNRK